ncbi:MAG: HAMP domain-containing protein [Spirochaetes bacterium]|nr:HAMP domain-containing protein [Spirochaetota bacterium]
MIEDSEREQEVAKVKGETEKVAPASEQEVPADKKEQLSKEKKEKKDKSKEAVKIKLPLSTQIIWLVIAILLVVVIVVYQVTLTDEKEALVKQMELRGRALTMNLANNSQVVLSSAVSEALASMGGNKVTRAVYERMDLFELGLSESVMKMIDQEDVIYAYIINPFNQILAHSEKQINILSDLKLPAGIKKYLENYKDGQKVRPILQRYFSEYINPLTKEKVEGEILDISFPLKLAQESESLKTYEGEVHMGLSLEGIQSTIQDAKGKLLNVAFLSIIFGIAGAYLLALFISKPIKTMVSAMRKVSKGDLNQSVKIKRADEIGLLGWSFNQMTEGLREKEKIKNTFNKFVSAEVAEEVLKGDGVLKLGGEYKEVTMFFSDIRSFTSMSEKMTPHEVISMLNEYLSLMTDIILEHKGIIDKYVGDEIMALWGAPIKRENDAELCVRAAVAQLKALEQLNKDRVARGEPEIQIGVGINTGQVVSGNMGSEKRLDYTVIGDNVNLASRLCDNAGKKGLHDIIMAESTYNLVKDIIQAKEVEPIYVKGKEKPIRIFEVLDIKDEYRDFTP